MEGQGGILIEVETGQLKPHLPGADLNLAIRQLLPGMHRNQLNRIPSLLQPRDKGFTHCSLFSLLFVQLTPPAESPYGRHTVDPFFAILPRADGVSACLTCSPKTVPTQPRWRLWQ